METTVVWDATLAVMIVVAIVAIILLTILLYKCANTIDTLIDCALKQIDRTTALINKVDQLDENIVNLQDWIGEIEDLINKKCK